MDGMLIGRVRGIDLKLNWSVFVIAVLIAWSLAESVFPEFVEGRSETSYWVAGAVTSAAFFASLLAHELGHSIVALREDVDVRGITLWLFGGVAQLGSEPKTPGASFRIAVAGPVVSAVLGVAGLAVGAVLDGLPQIAVLWFGLMNLVLVGFNLLPAFPLDGGRIYQSWQWKRTGDPVAATERAASLGLTIGAGLVALGVLEILLDGLVGGIWLMLIGWFIREAARAELRRATVGRPLSRLTVGEVMTPDPETVPGDITVRDFVEAVFHGSRHAAYPVLDASGAVMGLITLRRIRELPAEEAHTTRISQITTPLPQVLRADPAGPVDDLIQDMSARVDHRALVFEDGRLVGIVSPSDLTRLVSYVEIAAPIRRARSDTEQPA